MNEIEDQASLLKQNEFQAVAKSVQALRTNSFLDPFPPLRPGHNAACISTLIEEKTVELECIQDAVQLVGTQLNALHEGNEQPMSEEDEIAERTEELARLKREEESTYTYLEYLRSLLSPIRVLPVEVLTEIFEYCCGTLSTISLSDGPMLLSHVCSSWRAIVIGKREMWSSVKLVPGRPFTNTGGLLLAKLWLERSGNCPLSVHIQFITIQSCLSSLFVDLVRLYSLHFRRWKYIVFHHPYYRDAASSLFSDIPHDGSCPFLERFELWLTTISRRDSRMLSRLLHRAPRLRQIGWSIDQDKNSNPDLPYSQLTTLEGAYFMIKFLKILTEGRHLRTIHIHPLIPFGVIAADLVHVVHNLLTKVTLTSTGDSAVFFDTLTLPALQEFHITECHSTWSQSAFLSFLRRSKAILTIFRISGYDLTSANVLEILRILSPSLVEVEFKHTGAQYMTDEVLGAMTYPRFGGLGTDDPSSILCPRLRDMMITGCLSSTDGTLADMVESRHHPLDENLARLETGLFGIHSSKSPRDKERITGMANYVLVEQNVSGNLA